MNQPSFEIVRAQPEDAAALLDYLKIIGGETDNLSFGPEGVPLDVEEERSSHSMVTRHRVSGACPTRHSWNMASLSPSLLSYNPTERADTCMHCRDGPDSRMGKSRNCR